MCRYRLVFPQQAGEFDQISIILLNSQNVDVSVVETKTYKYSEFTEESLTNGKSFVATYPNEVFVLVMTDETQNYGDFTISYQFIDRDPEEVIRNMSEDERLAYYEKNKIVEEENIEDTDTFWFFVGGGILGAILIGILIL